ncbi:calcitonin gene-related peptide type 1 receptor-like [Tachypleus tridentatus]|uniref:calcitonin gene-related peptide type 1 receptor-like n=1 Tax=Tachypleus tridentatus TaxID=6853 RepID=UPI003FD0E6AC
MGWTNSYSILFKLLELGLVLVVHLSDSSSRIEADEVDKVLLRHQLKAYWMCRLNVTQYAKGNDTCPPEFDGWGCWEATPAGQVAKIECPSFGSLAEDKNFVTRTCQTGGKWATSGTDGKYDGDYFRCQLKEMSANHKKILENLLREMDDIKTSPYAVSESAQEFERCINDVLSNPGPTDKLYCPGTFDGWSCWNATSAGDVVYVPCPVFVTGFHPGRYAHKVCEEDGSWFLHPETNKTWSNYTTCIDKDDLSFRDKINKIYIAGYSISVIALSVSLVIFFYFRSMKCTRITIHKNLFVSFIINNILWIVWYTEVIRYPEVLFSNKIACQVLHVLVHYFLLSNYMWMFCEGLYLHTLLVIAFVAEDKIMKWFYILGWGSPIIVITCYAGIRSSYPEDTVFCWIEESRFTWILSGPVCIFMLLNFIFLINIVRVLVTKLRAVNSPDTHQTRKAVRATLILIPLLGLHYIITPFRPEPGSPEEAVYEPISAAVASFQGLCVSLLFCFFNGEVIALIKKKWQQTFTTWGNDTNRNYAVTTMSTMPTTPSHHDREDTTAV